MTQESLDERSRRIRYAWEKFRKGTAPFGVGEYPEWPEEVYEDHIVVRMGDDYWSVPCTDDGDEVTFDGSVATKVERTWVTVAESEDASFIQPLREADDKEPDGSTWRVRVIRKGLSKNGKNYSEEVLKEAVDLFDGVRVLARSDQAHLKQEDTSVEKIVGWLSDPVYEKDGVYADLNISEAASWLKTMLVDAWKRGKKDLAGLSIVAEGIGEKVRKGRQTLIEAKKITRVRTVDVVFNPSAGGEFVELVAADDEKEATMAEENELTIEQLEKDNPDLVASMRKAWEDDAAAKAKEADEAKASEDAKTEADAVKEGAKELVAAEAEDENAKAVAQLLVEAELGKTRLPEVARKKIAKRFEDGVVLTDLREAISEEVSMFEELERSNGVGPRSNGSSRDVSVGLVEAEKAIASLDGFFAGHDVKIGDETVPRYRSFKEAYIDLTGDGRDRGIVTGRLPLREADAGKLGFSTAQNGAAQIPFVEASDDGSMVFAEAGELQVSTWAQVLGDSITRRAVAEYKAASDLQEWQALVDVVPVSDFRTNRRTRVGGYADLADVAELGPYTDFTTPGDEEATYAATKRGKVDAISLEAIANDDMGYIRRLPQKMGRAAARTLMKFVLDFLRTNSAIYDSVTLFHATHGTNLGSTALSVASINTARQIMRSQTEADSSEALGLTPKHLFVPNELEQLAYELTASDRKPGTADNDANFVRAQTLVPHVVDYWTDANNWFLTADKSDVPLIELGFYGGEEPQVFTQDNPQVGSMFDNDTLKYKIRHIYGGAVLDYRGFFGAVVA